MSDRSKTMLRNVLAILGVLLAVAACATPPAPVARRSGQRREAL